MLSTLGSKAWLEIAHVENLFEQISAFAGLFLGTLCTRIIIQRTGRQQNSLQKQVRKAAQWAAGSGR